MDKRKSLFASATLHAGFALVAFLLGVFDQSPTARAQADGFAPWRDRLTDRRFSAR